MNFYNFFYLESKFHPLLDENGNVIHDFHGNPIVNTSQYRKEVLRRVAYDEPDLPPPRPEWSSLVRDVPKKLSQNSKSWASKSLPPEEDDECNCEKPIRFPPFAESSQSAAYQGGIFGEFPRTHFYPAPKKTPIPNTATPKLRKRKKFTHVKPTPKYVEGGINYNINSNGTSL